ncbi:MAG: 1-deoxy-D-xylulose-5-phosphate reductoisomerase [Armatimonadetes bacterium]|nr:1-deoxy-D-xylulose-5-phosphate reductoisomerase [Armatimonadota bacterium]NOG93767.1 1-deoxy-D-xylulose-5-phosphate reductoisomerase [Armatimonadota bacterium]
MRRSHEASTRSVSSAATAQTQKKRVAVLGSTGSIGKQTLEVLRMHSERFEVAALTANSNVELLGAQVEEFRPSRVAMFEEDAARSLASKLGIRVDSGIDAATEVAASDDIDIVVVCVNGVVGLLPTLAALDAGKHIALASKEVLVSGGAIVMPRVRSGRGTLLPIDSEHSAILQCLLGSPSLTSSVPRGGNLAEGVERIYITSSGGPFRNWTLAELETVSVDQALNHPTWRMGGKITIDSATLMNKGLELIEACWLYDVSPDVVQIVVHPQSVVHSMIKFRDGSVLAQMGHPDMKLPIQFALTAPARMPSPAKPWEPNHTPSLTFEPYDESVFICPSLARAAFIQGGTSPAFLNAVNEEAVHAFLRGRIRFLDIQRACERSLAKHPVGEATLDSVLAADREARLWFASEYV